MNRIVLGAFAGGRGGFTLAAALLLGMWLAAPGGAARAAPPNIIFILADDIGYGDFGCYGATRVRTPNVDRLAREGVRCTDAHAIASVCSPSRYAFLTGQYAFRNPAGAHILSGEAPLSIPDGTLTTAALLRQAGYTTGLVGKWHIGLGRGDLDWNKEIKPGPLEVGFDYAFFFPATGDRVPCVFIEDHRVVGLDLNDPIVVSYRSKVGNDPTGKEHPELLKLKPSAGHADTIINGISRIGFMSGGHAARWNDQEMADTLTRKAAGFIERNKDKPFFLYLATHDIHVPRVPHPRHRGMSGCGTRGDVIQEFDDCVGTVLDLLDRLGLAPNTLVIVTSDNGGVMDDGYADGADADAHGHRCNGALRGYKGSLWEGGHREPFIARWPGHIKPGSQCDQLFGLVDMMATFAAVAGCQVPEKAGPDSFNALPALLGEKGPAPVREHLVVQAGSPSQLAIRRGDWKFIPSGANRGYNQPTAAAGDRLFDLSSDLGENANLAARHPELVKELSGLLQKVRQEGRSRP